MMSRPLRCVAARAVRPQRRSAIALLTLLAASAAAQEGQQSQQSQESYTPAVLKLHEADFFYRSRIAPFTCTELQGRVASLLRALGARDDVEVRVTGCDAVVAPMEPADVSQGQSGRWGTPTNRWETAPDPFARSNQRNQREQAAHVRVRMMMPVEVTPEVLDQMEKDKSRRELISRVTGNAASFNDPIVFAARRQQVTLSRRTVDLEVDECELLEQMSSSIFRDLDIRVVQRGPRCDRYSISHVPPQMVVEALMPIMPSAPQATPAAGENEGDESSDSAEEAGSSDDPADPAAESKPQ